MSELPGIVVTGASGKMGQSLIAAILASDKCRLVGALNDHIGIAMSIRIGCWAMVALSACGALSGCASVQSSNVSGWWYDQSATGYEDEGGVSSGDKTRGSNSSNASGRR